MCRMPTFIASSKETINGSWHLLMNMGNSGESFLRITNIGANTAVATSSNSSPHTAPMCLSLLICLTQAACSTSFVRIYWEGKLRTGSHLSSKSIPVYKRLSTNLSMSNCFQASIDLQSLLEMRTLSSAMSSTLSGSQLLLLKRVYHDPPPNPLLPLNPEPPPL